MPPMGGGGLSPGKPRSYTIICGIDALRALDLRTIVGYSSKSILREDNFGD